MCKFCYSFVTRFGFFAYLCTRNKLSISIMARPKKQQRAKEPVTIRFKELAKGSKSVYLDIYRDGVRSYEFLKLYLIPERPGHPEDKTANLVTMDAANAIKAQRIKEIVNGEAGIKNQAGKALLLLDWMQQRQDRADKAAQDAGRKTSNTAETYKTAATHLRRYIDTAYKGRAVTLAAIDKDFCTGFAAYLKTAKKSHYTKNGQTIHKENKPIAETTAALYYTTFEAALNDAYKRGLISANPAALVEDSEKPTAPPVERDYLTADELKTLAAARCPNDVVRAAFLFSCFCGLRLSDIEALTWEKVHQDGDAWRIETRMQKTRQIIYLPLSAEARRFMPERGDKGPESLVFDLPKRVTTQCDIRTWVTRAGITKNITFHCARHTFATLALTQGADLYSISKLLGHTNVATTQVYAAIIDQRKQDAVNLLNGILD